MRTGQGAPFGRFGVNWGQHGGCCGTGQSAGWGTGRNPDRLGPIMLQEAQAESERVAWVIESSKLTRPGSAAMRVRVVVRIVIYAAAGFGAFVAVSRLLPQGPSMLAAIGAGCLVALAMLWPGRTRKAEVERAKALATEKTPPEARVRVHGKPRMLAKVMREGEVADRMFEPRVFYAIAATKSGRARKVTQIVAFCIVLTAMVCLQVMARGWRGSPVQYYHVLIALGAAALIGSLVFPTYLRVVPGRIDVMECGWLGLAIREVKKVSLREGPVVVDLRGQFCTVSPGQNSTSISYAAIRDRWAFVHAVLEAAVSTAEPPVLPDDELVG